jgi:FixJ family two-component response regulator
MKFWETMEFQRLRKQWYDELAKKGFDDAETLSDNLKSEFGRPMSPLKIEYYQGLSDALAKEQLPERDAFIMNSILAGETQKEIAKQLNMNQHTIGFIRRKYEHQWGLRHWKKHQLSSNRTKRE